MRGAQSSTSFIWGLVGEGDPVGDPGKEGIAAEKGRDSGNTFC